MKVLMVCLGNICRSPLAEGILQHKVKQSSLNWIVDSAATENYHIGNPPFHLSQKVALENNIDISHLKARRFSQTDIEHFDYIFVMASDVLQEMIAIAPEVKNHPKVKLLLQVFPSSIIDSKDVPDPYYGNYEGFRKVYNILDEACDTIINAYTS